MLKKIKELFNRNKEAKNMADDTKYEIQNGKMVKKEEVVSKEKVMDLINDKPAQPQEQQPVRNSYQGVQIQQQQEPAQPQEPAQVANYEEQKQQEREIVVELTMVGETKFPIYVRESSINEFLEELISLIRNEDVLKIQNNGVNTKNILYYSMFVNQ